jgi:Tat protein secretion system quality control protein TatD with DNase activity
MKFLRSIYSIKMQERILEQQAQQASLLAKVLSMHALGDDALMQ